MLTRRCDRDSHNIRHMELAVCCLHVYASAVSARNYETLKHSSLSLCAEHVTSVDPRN